MISLGIAGMFWVTRVRDLNISTAKSVDRTIDVPHPADGHLRPDDAFLARRTPVEFEGVVLERLKSDGFWCGVMASYQGVRYRITRPLEGGIASREVVVFHALVGPPLCETEQPLLSRAIFHAGARLRIHAERTGKGALVAGENPSTVTVLDEP